MREAGAGARPGRDADVTVGAGASGPAPPGYDAVLLAGFGGPEGPDDVLPFLRNVTRGRGVPEHRLAEVAEHYRALGGVSPINAQNRALREALEVELAGRGVPLPVYWGNRNWSPYLADAVGEAHRAGHRTLLGLATSAYSSYSSCRQYREDFAAALLTSGLLGEVRIDKLRPYYDHPGFLAPFADGLAEALAEAAGHGWTGRSAPVVFTTHSIPLAMAEASGAPAEGQLYVQQHLAACQEVVRLVTRLTGTEPSWQLAYQSRSGPAHIPWLEPDVCDVIAGLPNAGARAVIVVPIGFVSDHVEVIWDLDTEAADAAARAGLWFRRVGTPGTDPRFVAGLADLIRSRVAGGPPVDPVTALPARPDSCPPGCCRARVLRPTTAGADSAADWADTGTDPTLLAGSGIAGAVHR